MKIVIFSFIFFLFSSFSLGLAFPSIPTSPSPNKIGSKSDSDSDDCDYVFKKVGNEHKFLKDSILSVHKNNFFTYLEWAVKDDTIMFDELYLLIRKARNFYKMKREFDEDLSFFKIKTSTDDPKIYAFDHYVDNIGEEETLRKDLIISYHRNIYIQDKSSEFSLALFLISLFFVIVISSLIKEIFLCDILYGIFISGIILFLMFLLFQNLIFDIVSNLLIALGSVF